MSIVIFEPLKTDIVSSIDAYDFEATLKTMQ